MELNKEYKWENGQDEGLKCSSSHYVAYDGACYDYVMLVDKKSDDLFVICAAAGVETRVKSRKYGVCVVFITNS